MIPNSGPNQVGIPHGKPEMCRCQMLRLGFTTKNYYISWLKMNGYIGGYRNRIFFSNMTMVFGKYIYIYCHIYIDVYFHGHIWNMVIYNIGHTMARKKPGHHFSLRIRGWQRPRFQEATHRARRLMAREGFDGHDWKNDWYTWLETMRVTMVETWLEKW